MVEMFARITKPVTFGRAAVFVCSHERALLDETHAKH